MTLPVLAPNPHALYIYRSLNSIFALVFGVQSWVSPPIALGTSAASTPTGFARAWRPSGGVQFSVVAARRAAGASPSNCRASTPARDDGRGFPRRFRMTRGADLKATIQEGKRIRTVNLDVRVLASPLPHSRVGIIVPRHRHTAVDRNRLKRRLRELVRIDLLPPLRTGSSVDLAIRARREAYGAAFDGLRADVHTVRRTLVPDASAGAQSAE
jgi:ribonuclease P protein component